MTQTPVNREQGTGNRERTQRVPPVSGLSKASSSGFTLLGVLIGALFIVLVSTGLVFTAQRTGRVATATKERLISTLLAREGVELVRAIRDNNWLATPRCPAVGACTIFWRGQTSGPGALCNGTFRIDADALELLPASAGSEETRLALDGTAYRHGSGTPTTYRRWVTIESPEEGCGTPSIFSLGSIPAPQPPQPLTVRVVVAWDDNPDASCAPGRQCVELREDLHPWMNFR
ncbi:MAG: hypothetical protein G01um1014106_64 [Parcubacteria group bacterium Gr01-1014_106]|nr:MAG: hypothetical protein G01um1014106_64 [Parcubacteria group bacterium Gr01-1014_106]